MRKKKAPVSEGKAANRAQVNEFGFIDPADPKPESGRSSSKKKTKKRSGRARKGSKSKTDKSNDHSSERQSNRESLTQKLAKDDSDQLEEVISPQQYEDSQTEFLVKKKASKKKKNQPEVSGSFQSSISKGQGITDHQRAPQIRRKTSEFEMKLEISEDEDADFLSKANSTKMEDCFCESDLASSKFHQKVQESPPQNNRSGTQQRSSQENQVRTIHSGVNLQTVKKKRGFTNRMTVTMDIGSKSKDILLTEQQPPAAAPHQIKIMRHFILSPSTIPYQAWKILLILLTFASAFTYVFAAAFFDKMGSTKKNLFSKLDIAYQLVFFIDLCLQFITEHQDPITQEIERDPVKLAVVYLKGRFIIDIVTIIPFYNMLETIIEANSAKKLFAIKLLRLSNIYHLLSHKQFMSQIKLLNTSRLRKKISSSSEFANDKSKDHTNITKLIYISYIVRIGQMVFVLLGFSFFIGLLWYLKCDTLRTSPEGSTDENNFLVYFDLDAPEKSSYDLAIAMFYFASTTITTVGLGDFHPRNNGERMIGVYLMLSGALLTSYLMEQLTRMIKAAQMTNKDYEDCRQLSLFLATLQKFNCNRPLPEKTSSSIESYFRYRWSQNLNNAVRTQADQEIMEQLPSGIQDQIFTDFLFSSFFDQYKGYFVGNSSVAQIFSSMKKTLSSHFSERVILQFFYMQQPVQWGNEAYQRLLVKISQNLEPLSFVDNQVVLKPKQKVDSVIFITEGEFEVGFNSELLLMEAGLKDLKETSACKKFVKSWFMAKKMSLTSMFSKEDVMTRSKKKEEEEQKQQQGNKKLVFPLKFSAGQSPIGMFEACFDKRAQFLFKVSQSKKEAGCQAMFIRIQAMKELVASTPEFEQVFIELKNSHVINQYLSKIYFPMKDYQATFLKKQIAGKRLELKSEMSKLGAKIEQATKRLKMNQAQSKSLLKKMVTRLREDEELFSMASFEQFQFKGNEFKDDDDEERKSDEGQIQVSNLYNSEKHSNNTSFDQISVDNVDSNGTFQDLDEEVAEVFVMDVLNKSQKSSITKTLKALKNSNRSVHGQLHELKMGAFNREDIEKIWNANKRGREQFLRDLQLLKSQVESRKQVFAERKQLSVKGVVAKDKDDPVLSLLTSLMGKLTTNNYRLYKSNDRALQPETCSEDVLKESVEHKIENLVVLTDQLLQLFYLTRNQRQLAENQVLELSEELELARDEIRYLRDRADQQYEINEMKQSLDEPRLFQFDNPLKNSDPRELSTEKKKKADLLSPPTDLGELAKNLNEQYFSPSGMGALGSFKRLRSEDPAALLEVLASHLQSPDRNQDRGLKDKEVSFGKLSMTNLPLVKVKPPAEHVVVSGIGGLEISPQSMQREGKKEPLDSVADDKYTLPVDCVSIQEGALQQQQQQQSSAGVILTQSSKSSEEEKSLSDGSGDSSSDVLEQAFSLKMKIESPESPQTRSPPQLSHQLSQYSEEQTPNPSRRVLKMRESQVSQTMRQLNHQKSQFSLNKSIKSKKLVKEGSNKELKPPAKGEGGQYKRRVMKKVKEANESSQPRKEGYNQTPSFPIKKHNFGSQKQINNLFLQIKDLDDDKSMTNNSKKMTADLSMIQGSATAQALRAIGSFKLQIGSVDSISDHCPSSVVAPSSQYMVSPEMNPTLKQFPKKKTNLSRGSQQLGLHPQHSDKFSVRDSKKHTRRFDQVSIHSIKEDIQIDDTSIVYWKDTKSLGSEIPEQITIPEEIERKASRISQNLYADRQISMQEENLITPIQCEIQEEEIEHSDDEKLEPPIAPQKSIMQSEESPNIYSRHSSSFYQKSQFSKAIRSGRSSSSSSEKLFEPSSRRKLVQDPNDFELGNVDF